LSNPRLQKRVIELKQRMQKAVYEAAKEMKRKSK
jgi:hypothetical protein